MSYEVWPLEDDKWELVFFDEPAYIHALQMAPTTMESELNTGVWLVVAFPVWSTPARYAVQAAFDRARDNAGKFELGVRPFESHTEIDAWWPSREVQPAAGYLLTVKDHGPGREARITADHSRIPTWLVLRDGEVMYQGVGPRSRDELNELMQNVLKEFM